MRRGDQQPPAQLPQSMRCHTQRPTPNLFMFYLLQKLNQNSIPLCKCYNVCEKRAKRLCVPPPPCAFPCPSLNRAAAASALFPILPLRSSNCKPLTIILRCTAELYAELYGNTYAFPVCIPAAPARARRRGCPSLRLTPHTSSAPWATG